MHERPQVAREKPRRPAQHCTAWRCPETRALALPKRYVCQGCASRLDTLGEEYRTGERKACDHYVVKSHPRHERVIVT